ncbi:predicted protein [Sclerotinia sclerotiorum 1980 UF-70]|uniref:Uncharacterized protein n=1 Tax=Sclerotinia sclerotiorum (strain ATCC 18683 / 1980 / Ss-1) TaxID=665079 RepID=A7E4K1_SCLS1|nr:predicted protein [Sclerotinia sclerotiorum 1980 UF-70]EDN90823.1 predicted protein [Sclerotinia sclerotiorum 1980 UF-70]
MEEERNEEIPDEEQKLRKGFRIRCCKRNS